MVNRTAGSMDIMLESRAPVHVSEQLPWYQSEMGWNRKYVRGRHSVNDVNAESAIVSRD